MKNTKASLVPARDITIEYHPGLTVTPLIFTVNQGVFEILLIKRTREPYQDLWSLPGDFIEEEESLDEGAQRVLQRKTGISDVYLEQLYTFGDTKRDPRGRVITVAYFALLPHDSVHLLNNACWMPVKNLPKLAFDHKEIISYGVERVKSKLTYSNIVHNLLPEKFRLSQMQQLYEIILEESIDKRNFSKKMKSLGILVPLKETYRIGNHRPAQLYSFKSKKLETYDTTVKL